MKVKLEDIAQKAGVSTAAVSMALNNKKGVSDETRQIIIRIAEEMGYTKRKDIKELQYNTVEPQFIKFLRFQKHGYVVSDTAFFAQLIEGVELECKKNNFELLVSNLKCDSEQLSKIYKNYENKNVKGLIVLATELDHEDIQYLRQVDIPFVIVDNYFVEENMNTVLMNNRNATFQAVKHFVVNGHSQIGYLQSSISIHNFRERFKGYLDALRLFGLQYNSKYVYKLESTLEGSYRDMKALLENDSLEMPTAVLADNDIIAFGAMRALQNKKLSIPKDISIIGIDDMPFCMITNPRLTTIRIFKREIGMEAVKTIINQINDGNNITQKKEINTELVERESVLNLKTT